MLWMEKGSGRPPHAPPARRGCTGCRLGRGHMRQGGDVAGGESRQAQLGLEGGDDLVKRGLQWHGAGSVSSRGVNGWPRRRSFSPRSTCTDASSGMPGITCQSAHGARSSSSLAGSGPPGSPARAGRPGSEKVFVLFDAQVLPAVGQHRRLRPVLHSPEQGPGAIPPGRAEGGRQADAVEGVPRIGRHPCGFQQGRRPIHRESDCRSSCPA